MERFEEAISHIRHIKAFWSDNKGHKTMHSMGNVIDVRANERWQTEPTDRSRTVAVVIQLLTKSKAPIMLQDRGQTTRQERASRLRAS